MKQIFRTLFWVSDCEIIGKVIKYLNKLDNVHNMMICAPEILDVIKESINEKTKISILDVTDEQFKKMEYYKGV